MVGKIREAKVDYVAINGKLTIDDLVTRAKLLYAMRLFRDAVKLAHHLIRSGLEWKEVERRLTKYMSNAHYGHSAYQKAKLWKNQPYLRLRNKFLFSVGKSHEKGNRNIRLTVNHDSTSVKVKIPHADGKHEWIVCKAKFGRRHFPLLKKLTSLNNVSYGVEISEDLSIHVYVPFQLYKDFFGKKPNNGEHIASFDLNSDRINMIIVDKNGNILDVRNEHFPEVTSHGFPKNKARDTRLKAFVKLLDYAYYHNVEVTLFEDLERIKRRRFTNSVKANRKISKFAKHELLQYGVTMALKRGFKVFLVSPVNTSKIARKIHSKLGLDVHTASAYILAKKFINTHKRSQILTKT